MLTQNQIARVSKPGRYQVDRTLFLNVAKAGTRSWVQRFTENGRQREIGLGGYPTVSVAEAKEIALQNRLKVKYGEAIETKSGIPTFRDVAIQTIEQRKVSWRNPEATIKKWVQALELHVFPSIGFRKVTDLKGQDFFGVLMPLLNEKKFDQCESIKKYLHGIMKNATAHGYVDSNVMASVTLPKRLETKNFQAVHYSTLPSLLKNMKTWKCREVTKHLLEFQLVTATRPSEARQAQWQEIDFTENVWTIPASRMKMNRVHRIPLSNRAVEILQEMASKTSENAPRFVFHNKGRPLSRTIINDCLKRNNLESTAHGFRSAFRSWCADHSVSFEVAEMCLSHVQNKTVRAYQRSDLLEQRREVMQAWADYLNQ